MGNKLNEFEIELAIKKDSNTQFETCCYCGGIEEGMVMLEVDYDSFDVCCEECNNMKDTFDEWVKDNVFEYKNGYATQDAQYQNRLKGEKELYKYFIKEFCS